MMPRSAFPHPARSPARDAYGRDMTDLGKLARRFQEFGGSAANDSPLYARLSSQIADDPSVVAILASAPDTQQMPVLLFAAVHDLVLTEPDQELAEWYATVTPEVRADDPYPTFAALCRDRADDLRATIASRSTQTNEVARCAFYLPALSIIEREVGPLSLVDVGASAGLNLNLDRYRYHYTPGGPCGPDSPVVIDAGTRGDPPVPSSMPLISARVGLDASPVDAVDPAAARWLRACVWPDQVARSDRLRAALAIAADHPPEVRLGDAVASVAGLAREAGEFGHPVVMNSWVLNYLTDEQRVAYVEQLDAVGADRDLSWVFAESPYRCAGLPMPTDQKLAHLTLVMLARWRGGERTLDHVATAHPHGRWLHWGATSFGRSASD